MTHKEYRQLLEKDRNKYKSFKYYRFLSGYKLTKHLRKCQYLATHKLLFVFYLIERVIYHHICEKMGCDIPSHCKIGGGFKIIHSYGIVINADAEIGENFTILSGSVIGGNHGVPKIGNNVSVGANATVIGNITIGNNVEIGAGSVVTHSCPDNSVVFGEAAKIKRIKENI